jgi:hypothetical protein
MTKRESIADIRADVVEKMTPLGQRRIALLAELGAVEQELKPLVAEALDLRITYREIYETTGVTANTVRDWWRKANAAAA